MQAHVVHLLVLFVPGQLGLQLVMPFELPASLEVVVARLAFQRPAPQSGGSAGHHGKVCLLRVLVGHRVRVVPRPLAVPAAIEGGGVLDLTFPLRNTWGHRFHTEVGQLQTSASLDLDCTQN